MAQPSPVPEEEIAGSGELGQELAGLRARLRILEEIDEQTTEMVVRLAEAVRSSAEVRAQASLDIAVSLDRVERLLADHDRRQRMVMRGIQQDVTVAQARVVGLASIANGLEAAFLGLQERLAQAETQETTDGGPVDPPIAIPTPIAAPTTVPQNAPAGPRPAASSFMVEFEQVPSASAALSIQRFITELPGVVAATTREYAGGHLRLEVRTRGAVSMNEIGTWPGGRLEVVGQSQGRITYRVVG
jgi:hypothetical protein